MEATQISGEVAVEAVINNVPAVETKIENGKVSIYIAGHYAGAVSYIDNTGGIDVALHLDAVDLVRLLGNKKPIKVEKIARRQTPTNKLLFRVVYVKGGAD